MAAPRILVVPGGTAINAVALANASIHKLVELYEERQADPNHPAPHTVVFLRDPALEMCIRDRRTSTCNQLCSKYHKVTDSFERLNTWQVGVFDGTHPQVSRWLIGGLLNSRLCSVWLGCAPHSPMRVLRPRLVGNSATPLERARPDADVYKRQSISISSTDEKNRTALLRKSCAPCSLVHRVTVWAPLSELAASLDLLRAVPPSSISPFV